MCVCSIPPQESQLLPLFIIEAAVDNEIVTALVGMVIEASSSSAARHDTALSWLCRASFHLCVLVYIGG